MSCAVAAGRQLTVKTNHTYCRRERRASPLQSILVSIATDLTTHNLTSQRRSQKDATNQLSSGTRRRSYPKNATARQRISHHPDIPAIHQPTSDSQLSTMGPCPSSCSVSCSRAGMMPTKPAASGIVPVATAVVCRTTFSCGVRGLVLLKIGHRGMTLKTAKPINADWSDIIEIQPVWCERDKGTISPVTQSICWSCTK